MKTTKKSLRRIVYTIPPFWRYAAGTALAATGMMLLFYAFLGVVPFGDGTIITGDLNGQYISYYAHFKRVFTSDAGFFYGFDKGLGGALAGLFAYYCASPLNLLYLLVPVSAFPLMSGAVLAIKIVLACAFMAGYLQAKFPALGWKSMVLGLCYGFCAFNFAYAQSIMWHDVVLLLPLICLGLDRILAGKSNLLYILCLAMAIFANFYIAFMACIFVVLYLVASLVLAGRPLKDQRKPLLSFLGGSLVAGGLCLALLLPALYNINASKGELLAWQFTVQPNFSLLALPQKLLWGSFNGLADMEAGLPLLYAGLLPLLLSVCFFISRRVRAKEKLVAGGLLAVMLFSFWLSGPDLLWHGLKRAVWFPYRNAWLFVFLLVLLAGAAFAKKAVGRMELPISAAVLAAVCVLCLELPGEPSWKKLLLCLVALVVFAVLLWGIGHWRGRTFSRVLALGLVGAVALELVFNAWYITNQLEKYPYSKYLSFLDETGGSVQAIQADDDGTYRMDKNFFRSLNDPMLLNYHGVSHFGSTQDNGADRALDTLGYRGYPSYLYGSTAFSDSALGIRYLIADDSRPVPAHWQPADMDAPLDVLKNDDSMPMLFAAAGDFADLPEDAADSFAGQNALCRAMSGSDDALLQPVSAVRLAGTDGAALLDKDSLGPDDYFTFTAEVPGYYYALAQAQDDALYDLPILIDGEARGSYFAADYSGVINLGYREAGDVVTLSWPVEAPIFFEDVWFAVLSPDRLAALSEEAWQNAAECTLADGLVQGTVTADEDHLWLYTSIPYDPNWHATVNGQTVEAVEYGGLLWLPLRPGQNQLELRYVQAGATPGLVASLATLAVWLGFLAVRRYRRRAAAAPAAKAKPKP